MSDCEWLQTRHQDSNTMLWSIIAACLNYGANAAGKNDLALII